MKKGKVMNNKKLTPENIKNLTPENIFDIEENDVKKTRSEWEEIIKEEIEFESDEELDDELHEELDDEFIAKPKIFKNDDFEYKVFNIDGDIFIKSESGNLVKISELIIEDDSEWFGLFETIYIFKDPVTDESFDYELIKEISESYDIFSEENEQENEQENDRRCRLPWQWFS